MWLFCYFDFEKDYNVLKLKSPYILLNKDINFKNETKLKMANATHSFRQTLYFSSYKNCKLKL